MLIGNISQVNKVHVHKSPTQIFNSLFIIWIHCKMVLHDDVFAVSIKTLPVGDNYIDGFCEAWSVSMVFESI